MTEPPAACVFDAYGTLFDVAGAARAFAAEPGREGFARVWEAVAEAWRLKQLQYSWLRAVEGRHADFRQVTGEALEWALEAAGLGEDLHTPLMALYDRLPAYPEAADALARLRAAGRRTAILSNGTPKMLASAVGAAGLGEALDAVISVEEVGAFKPARAVYDLVGQRLGTAPGEVLFVSANGWDAAAGAAYGFRAAWVNRRGEPVDRLPGRPAHVVPDLSAIPGLVGA